MERNISGVIRFVGNKINISVIEKLSTSIVGIFDASTNISESHTFIERSLQLIERKIGARLKVFTIIIEDNESIESRIEIAKKGIQLADYKVTRRDIDNVIELTKQEFLSEKRRVTLIQPVKFTVVGEVLKNYSVAPIDRIGNELEITFAVTTISSDVYKFIKTITEVHGISIKCILLSSQSITQNNLSEGINEKGAALVSVTTNNVSLSINKNKATVSTCSIYNLGYKQLVNGVAKVFNCDYESALNLINVYGNLTTNTNRIIQNNFTGQENQTYTEQDLNNIIKVFLNRITLVLKKFLEERNVAYIPVVLSEKLENIIGAQDYIRDKLKTEVSLYTPLTLIENTLNYKYAIGAQKLHKHMEDQKVIKENSIINTNPNDIKVIHSRKKKTLFQRMITKIGGEYDRN
ncbi:MAG: hypothetical protein DSZ21_02510 [Tenericutes bacterium]|nr:MAG: hypothetical protein DSZ21_02510 [Mycoplasmatota bacterium]